MLRGRVRPRLTAPPSRRRDRENTLARARRAVDYLKWGCSGLAAEIEGLLALVQTRLEEAAPHPVHFDLKVDHLFLADDRVTFIDLDSHALGDPVFDPATLLARLAIMPVLHPVPAARIDRLSRAFEERYFARVPAAWHGRLAANHGCAALKIALDFLQQLAPDRDRHIERIVADATARLEA